MVFFHDGLAFEVSQSLVLEWGLRIGGRLSAAEQRQIVAQEQVLLATEQVLPYLDYRPRTAHEVRQKLRRSGYADAVVEQAVQLLHARGVLNDAAYAHTYCRTRLDVRGHGPQRIRQVLRQRGIPGALIDEALRHSLTARDVLAAAREQAAKRWRRFPDALDPLKRRQKLTDFLRRRGFAYETARQVLQELEQGGVPEEG
jgi:regulatory protein